MIQRTFFDDNPEDRNYQDHFWHWIKDQPQDAWLLWARGVNWDSADLVFKRMIADPRCDLALVAYLFWNASPEFAMKNPSHFISGDLVYEIVKNLECDFYSDSNLFYDRREFQRIAQHLRNYFAHPDSSAAAFRLPRILCGPFNGRKANVPLDYGQEIEDELAEFDEFFDGKFARDESEHWDRQVAGGNVLLDRLEDIPSDSPSAFADLDDAGYIDRVFRGVQEPRGATKNDNQPLVQKAVEWRKPVVTIRQIGVLSGNSGVAEWRKSVVANPAEPKSGIEQVLERINGLTDFTAWQAVKFLFGFFVVALAVAFTLRRINFGVWF